MIIPFFLIRLADIITTYLAMSKYGGWADIEANPFNAWLISNMSYGQFAVINLMLSGVAYFVLSRMRFIFMKIFMGIMLVVVAINTFTLTI